MSYNDTIRLKSTREVPEIAASFCQHIFDDFVIEVGGDVGNRRATVDKGPFSIITKRSNLPEHIKQMEMDDYGFIPNIRMPIFYSKSDAIWVENNGEWDIPPLRDAILKGVVGLIKKTDDSMVFRLDNPEREVLIRHAGELTLLEDPFWTEDRLLLFEDIPYNIEESANKKVENPNSNNKDNRN